jgi:hypothetical protein
MLILLLKRAGRHLHAYPCPPEARMSPQPTDPQAQPLPPRTRIVGWHLEFDDDRLCKVAAHQGPPSPASVIVDFGDGSPVNVCASCRPADAYDEFAEILRQVSRP